MTLLCTQCEGFSKYFVRSEILKFRNDIVLFIPQHRDSQIWVSYYSSLGIDIHGNSVYRCTLKCFSKYFTLRGEEYGTPLYAV